MSDVAKWCEEVSAMAAVLRKEGISRIVDDQRGIEIVMQSVPAAAPAPVRPPPDWLAPPRPAASIADRFAQHQKATAEQRHATMFAASRMRPLLEEPQAPASVVPRAVRAKQDATRGKATAAKR